MPPESLPQDPNAPHPLESLQEAMIMQGEEIKNNGDETNSLLQALIAQGESDNDDLIKAQIAQADENTEKIVEAVKESTFNFQLEGVEMATLTGPQGEKGDKGDKGDIGFVTLEMPDGTIQQSEGTIRIQGLKGDKGDKGETGPAGRDGKDGKDGQAFLGINGKNGRDGIDGKDGVDGLDGKDGSPDTPKQIKKKLESLKDDDRLDVKAIKGIKDFQKQIDKVAGFASQGQEYRISGTKISSSSGVLNLIPGNNTTITGVPTSDGADITITATGGGGGAVDSVNGQTGVVVLDAGDISGFATVATSGSYDDLSDKPTIPTGTVDGTLTVNEIVYGVDGNTIGSLPVATYPSLAELAYVKGVTSAIQTQLSGLASSKQDTLVSGTNIKTINSATLVGSGNISVATSAQGALADTALQPSAIGVSVQAYDADLTTWGGKTAPSGAVLGTTDTQTLTNKRITKRTGTATSSATPTINTDNVDFYSLTAQAVDITSFTTNLSGTPTEGQTLIIAITGTGARAITWGASFEASTVALPTTTVTTNRLDVGFIWNTVTSKWRCVATA